MGNYTTNLSLYNTDMTTDGNDTFDFQRDLNDNNDKIDSAFGNLANLSTTQKANLVSAINEIVSNLDGKTSKSLNDLNAVGQAILDKKVEVEALLAQNGYAKFSWKENNQISNLIVQWGDRVFSADKSVNANAVYDVSQNYPINFVGTASCVLMNTYNQAFKASVKDRTLNSFSCSLKNVGNSTATVGGFIWFCIGY